MTTSSATPSDRKSAGLTRTPSHVNPFRTAAPRLPLPTVHCPLAELVMPRWLPAVGQPAPQVRGPRDVPLLDAQLGAAELLEERRLGLDEQLVDRGDRQVVDQPQVDPHPHARKQKHRFFAGDRLGGLQDAIGPADLVVQVLPALGEQGLAGRALVLEDLGDDVGEDLDQLGLGLAQGLLVGDLVEVAGGLAPLAVEAADGQVDLLEGPEDLVDLLGLDQARAGGASRRRGCRCRRWSGRRSGSRAGG